MDTNTSLVNKPIPNRKQQEEGNPNPEWKPHEFIVPNCLAETSTMCLWDNFGCFFLWWKSNLQEALLLTSPFFLSSFTSAVGLDTLAIKWKMRLLDLSWRNERGLEAGISPIFDDQRRMLYLSDYAVKLIFRAHYLYYCTWQQAFALQNSIVDEADTYWRPREAAFILKFLLGLLLHANGLNHAFVASMSFSHVGSYIARTLDAIRYTDRLDPTRNYPHCLLWLAQFVYPYQLLKHMHCADLHLP